MEYAREAAIKLSTNFISTEFNCHCGKCAKTKISKELINYLQQIRDHFNKPVTINSGYRCSAHNKAVGGASSSNHTKGMAADIAVKDVEPKEVAAYAESIGVKGIGLYETAQDGFFVHIDTRLTKYFWYGQGQQYRSTFNEATTNNELTSQEQNLVKEWQLAAIADGFSFPAFGADGLWGAECVRVARAARVKRSTRNHNLTKFVQRALNVSIDGICGDETTAAIKKYQKQKGLRADGVVGLNTWKALLQ